MIEPGSDHNGPSCCKRTLVGGLDVVPLELHAAVQAAATRANLAVAEEAAVQRVDSAGEKMIVGIFSVRCLTLQSLSSLTSRIILR
jgi:hypothetical protein